MLNRNNKFSIILFAATFLCASIAFAQPKVQEFSSPKGIKYWSIEDNYLPIVSIRIAFTKTGVAYEPDNKLGLTNMVANLMAEGAGGISGIDYIKKLEELASNISFSADEDNFFISLTCLKENIDESMRLLSLALTSPNFTPDALQRVRSATLVSIAKQTEKPEILARKTFQENYFGNHPYSRQTEGTIDGVKSIKRNDLFAFVKQHFARENMIIGAAGSVSADELNSLFDKYLSILPEHTGNIPDIAEFVPGNNIAKIVQVEKDLPQSVVIFGFPGPKRNDADFYSTYLANYILGGGGFESRLMQEIREKNGLAYTVNTSLQTQKKAGIITGYVATKNESVDESIKILRQEIERIQQKNITQQELSDADDYLIGSFPLRMTQNEALAAFITSMQYDNLGIDFLEKRNGYIKDVTLSQANDSAAKYLDVNNMLVVVVGKQKQ